MDFPESLQILRNELVRRGLPRDYVARVTGELADHVDDMAAEAGCSVTSATSVMRPQLADRLGDPVRLADGIAREFQRRTFLGRHPWLAFVALPAGAMIAAWVATNVIIVLLVQLLLGMGGAIPSDAWRWAAAIVAGTLAYGMTYGMPVLLWWWALRKARQTTRAWSWAWATTTVLVLASFMFRISVFRMDNGRFGIDSSIPLRFALGVLYGDSLSADWKFWRWMLAGSFSFAYLAQLAVLISATAFAIRRSRRALATLVSTEPTEKATA
jgi:hypothetical protein